MVPSTLGTVSESSEPVGHGWRPRRAPNPERPQDIFVSSPFARLARVHAFSVAGDALIAVALANSLFFSIDPQAARWRVALYLLLTMAPFAVVSPLIGPAIDRAGGGRKWMVMGSAALRVLICIVMVGNLDSLWLFPEAFAILVLGKGYQVAKSAIVPTTVRTDAELVEANSKLSLISGLAGVIAVPPGLLLAKLGGSEWVIGLAAMVFTVAAMAPDRSPASFIAPKPLTFGNSTPAHAASRRADPVAKSTLPVTALAFASTSPSKAAFITAPSILAFSALLPPVDSARGLATVVAIVIASLFHVSPPSKIRGSSRLGSFTLALIASTRCAVPSR